MEGEGGDTKPLSPPGPIRAPPQPPANRPDGPAASRRARMATDGAAGRHPPHGGGWSGPKGRAATLGAINGCGKSREIRSRGSAPCYERWSVAPCGSHVGSGGVWHGRRHVGSGRVWHGVAAILGAAECGTGGPYRLPRLSASLGGQFPVRISFVVKGTAVVSLPPVSVYPATASDEGTQPQSSSLPSAAAGKETGRNPCGRSSRSTTPCCWDTFPLLSFSDIKPPH